MRVPTRKQLSNLRARKDPKRLARSTKVHDDKHAYNRHTPVVCEDCGNDAVACECAHITNFDIGDF